MSVVRIQVRTMHSSSDISFTKLFLRAAECVNDPPEEFLTVVELLHTHAFIFSVRAHVIHVTEETGAVQTSFPFEAIT